MMANDGIALKEPAVSLKLKLFRIIFQTDRYIFISIHPIKTGP